MTRSLIALIASLAVLVPMADTASANHDRNRNAGVLRIGPFAFRSGTRAFARLDRRRGVVVTRSVAPPFAFDRFDPEENFPAEQAQGGYWHLPPGDRDRAALLDRDLGRALEQLRRDLGRRSAEPPFPRTFDAPLPRVEVEVSRLPAPGIQPAPSAGGIIKEEAVIGPVPPLEEPVSPVTSVGIATVADVATHGPEAFAILSQPQSLGLPALAEGQHYYVLNGKVVTLEAEALQALTVAALTAALE